ncbi:hypothetical protein ACSBL2_09680 [Pedobacter sp. AW31-3R]|uniref:hypothetical protein n=1 Tax=Pedobacter sp. AW31-3R TaxID=3445781 RepID=UPI003FA0A3CE
MRNSIVNGGEYKGNLVGDYIDLFDKVRRTINSCNTAGQTKEQLFEQLNLAGF